MTLMVHKISKGKIYSQDDKNYNGIKKCSDCIDILIDVQKIINYNICTNTIFLDNYIFSRVS